MDNFSTYAALCKGYCAINILILPKQFDNGGWLVGIVAIFVAAFFVLACAQMLVKCGLRHNTYNYSEIARLALG